MSTTTDPADFLEHFGVKGMKWGKHTAGSDSGSSGGSSGGSSKSSTSSKPTSADIKAARGRTREKEKALGEKENAYYSATTTKGREQALNVFKKAENKFYNDPDVALGEKHTRGEKIANGMSNVMVGLLIVGGVAATVASKR